MAKKYRIFVLFSFLFAVSTYLSAAHLTMTSLNNSALFSGYQVIQIAFAKDSFTQAKSAAENLEVAVQKWIDEKGTSDPQYVNVSQMRSGLDAIKLSKSDKELRTSFGLLSKGVVQFIREDPTLQSKWQLFFCPMTSDFGYWVQPKGEKIANPYMGQQMPSCGTKKSWSRSETL